MAVVFPATIYALVAVGLIAASVQAPVDGWLLRTTQLATVLGREVIDHLGWMFSILVALQLGCLIVLIGGQVAAPDRREEANLRSTLAVVSILPVVGLSPAITVAVVAAFRVGELRGALFVIVPALLVTVFLSVFIGTFEPADELTRLRFAEDRAARAQQQLDALEGRPTASLWWTTATMSGALVLLAFGAPLLLMVAAGAPIGSGWIYVASAALIITTVPLTVFTVSVVSAAIKPTLDAFGLATSVVLLGAVFLLQTAVVLMLCVLTWPVGLGMSIVTAFLVTETMRVLLEAEEVRADREPGGYWRSGGLLSRAGTLVARRSAGKERAEAEKTIAQLKVAIDRRVDEYPNVGGLHRREKPPNV